MWTSFSMSSSPPSSSSRRPRRSSRRPRPPRSPPPRPRPPPRGPRGPRPWGACCSSAWAGVASAACATSVGSVLASLVWFSSCILELQSAFARGVGEGLHPAMEQEAATIEHHGRNAGLLGALGKRLADCGSAVAGRPSLDLEVLVEAGGGDERLARSVVNDLRINVTARAVDRQARLAR